MSEGFIMLHRKIQQHWIYDEKRKFSKYEAWLDMLMLANHSNNKFLLGNELIELEIGQFVTSIRKLGERWDWSNTKVSQFLELLVKDEMLSVKKDTKKTVITIANYGFYHNKQDEKKTPIEREKDTEKTQKHTNNNVKNVKNENNNKKPTSPKFEICDMESAKLLFSKMQENNENVKTPNFDKWAEDIRKLRTLDKRPTEHINWLINWSQKDEFWKTNILSPSALRKQWDKLTIKAKAEHLKKQRLGQQPQQKQIDWENV
jgi:hypothetical protein